MSDLDNEELGYKITNKNKNTIQYYIDDDFYGQSIVFYIPNKTVNKHYNFTMQELKVVNKKCKELGWI